MSGVPASTQSAPAGDRLGGRLDGAGEVLEVERHLEDRALEAHGPSRARTINDRAGSTERWTRLRRRRSAPSEGDARDLPGVAPGSVDLVVTSPPYPMIPQWDESFRRWGATDYPAMHGGSPRCGRRATEPSCRGDPRRQRRRCAAFRRRRLPPLAEPRRRRPVRATVVGFRSLPYILWKKPTNKPNAFLGSGFLPPERVRDPRLRVPPAVPKGSPSRRSRGTTASAGGQPVHEGGAGPVVLAGVGRRPRRSPAARSADRTGAFPAEIPASADPDVLGRRRHRPRPVRGHGHDPLGGPRARPELGRGRGGAVVGRRPPGTERPPEFAGPVPV